MAEDKVAEGEVLYRGIRYMPDAQEGTRHYAVRSDGTVEISSEAFSDRDKEPSVDRAKIHKNDATRTQVEETDAVLKLIARDVRIIPVTKEKSPETYIVDVVPDPIVNHPTYPDNLAHAKIRTMPRCGSAIFRKFKISLAQLAESYADKWAILPVELRPESGRPDSVFEE